MSGRVYHVLFLCTHNSARSILAESILNDLGRGRFKGFSAGSAPSGKVNPLAIETLQNAGYHTSGLRSKSWDEFAKPGAPRIDFVITVCDGAAGEVCPVWPGQPLKIHWGFTDPSQIEGKEEARRAAFKKTCNEISRRIRAFVNSPIKTLDRESLKEKLIELGITEGLRL